MNRAPQLPTGHQDQGLDALLPSSRGNTMEVAVQAYIGNCFALIQFAKHSSAFSCQVRAMISDFAVFFTIAIMVVIDFLIGIPSPKLQVPHVFKVITWFDIQPV